MSDPEFEARIDESGVNFFALMLKDRLKDQRSAGYNGWHDPDLCPIERLYDLLQANVLKKDMVDVGNLAMMIYMREHWEKLYGGN